jgi:multidrug transporter EmrE-like cation transporter
LTESVCSTSIQIILSRNRLPINGGMKVKRDIFLIIFAIVFQALAGFSMKLASQSLSAFAPFSVLSNPFFVASLVALVLQALVWLQALKRYPLSIAYPCLSLVNFVILFVAAVYFKEGITLPNVVGLTVISFGVLILSRSEEAA